jgi:cell division FtsZ-interacting protein ZapD
MNRESRIADRVADSLEMESSGNIGILMSESEKVLGKLSVEADIGIEDLKREIRKVRNWKHISKIDQDRLNLCLEIKSSLDDLSKLTSTYNMNMKKLGWE